MIFKYELVDAINDTNHDVALLAINLKDLEEKVDKLEAKIKKLSTPKCEKKCAKGCCPKACPKKVEKKTKKTAKRGPGRPRKV